jgi:hypothetical protein
MSAVTRLQKHWLPAAAAVAVVAVIGIALAVSGGSGSGAPVGGSNGSSLSAVAGELLGEDPDAADTSRTLQSAPTTGWAVECASPLAPDEGRVEFAGVVETGPEYERSVQAAIFGGDDAAAAAAAALTGQIVACAATSGAAVHTATAPVGDATQVRTVIGDGGATSTYVVTVDGPLVVLGADHTVVAADAEPLDPTPTTDAVQHALDVLCEAGVGGCA